MQNRGASLLTHLMNAHRRQIEIMFENLSIMK